MEISRSFHGTGAPDVLIFLCLCLIVAGSTSALQCYHCDNCPDPLNISTATVVECSTACQKIETRNTPDGALMLTTRSCSSNPAPNRCLRIPYANGPIIFTYNVWCTCNDNLCNRVQDFGYPIVDMTPTTTTPRLVATTSYGEKDKIFVSLLTFLTGLGVRGHYFITDSYI